MITGLCAVIAAGLALAGAPACSSSPSDVDWVNTGNAWDEQHFSPVDQINADNADELGLACCDIVMRGLAWHDGKIIVGTLDGRLIALNEASGAIHQYLIARANENWGE